MLVLLVSEIFICQEKLAENVVFFIHSFMWNEIENVSKIVWYRKNGNFQSFHFSNQDIYTLVGWTNAWDTHFWRKFGAKYIEQFGQRLLKKFNQTRVYQTFVSQTELTIKYLLKSLRMFAKIDFILAPEDTQILQKNSEQKTWNRRPDCVK